MDIAHFVHRYPPALGGAEQYFERLTRFHQAHGDRVQVWTTTAIDLPAFWHSGFHELPQDFSSEIRRYHPWHFLGRRYLLKLASLFPRPSWQTWMLPCNPFCPRMRLEVDRFEGPVDAVHASAFPYSFPIACALRLAKRRKVPFFLTPFLHLGDLNDPADRTRKQYTQPALRWLLEQADGIFVQTRAEQNAVVALGIAPGKVILQGLGVDPDECTGGNREQTRAAWGVSADEIVIGHLANLSVEKGTVDLLKASDGRIRVVLAGPAMANFQRFWNGYPHKALVIPLGRISERDKRDFFAAIDLLCLPSRTDSFGLVLLEAWANAKPVVVYRAGGPGELVRDGIDGWVSPCDVRALSQALERCRDRTLLQRMGASGQQRVATEFEWSDRLRIVRDAIHACCSRQGVSSPSE